MLVEHEILQDASNYNEVIRRDVESTTRLHAGLLPVQRAFHSARSLAAPQNITLHFHAGDPNGLPQQPLPQLSSRDYAGRLLMKVMTLIRLKRFDKGLAILLPVIPMK